MDGGTVLRHQGDAVRRRDEVAPVFAEGPAIGDMSEADVRPAPH